MTNNKIKRNDGEQLEAYIETLSYKEYVEFITLVTCEANVERYIFHNWKSMATRIPDKAKQIIESVAGCKIFFDDNR